MSGQADIIHWQKPCLVSRWWRFESACRLQLGEIVLYPSLTPKGTPYIKSHGIKLGLTGKTFEFVKETLRCIWVGKPPFGEASTCHAILAQSVEQRFRKAKVVGSSPTDGSILGILSLAVCAYSR